MQSRGGGAGQPKLWPVSCTFVAGICRPLTPIATRLWHGCGTKPQPHARAGIVSQSSAATPVPEESRRNPQAPHLRHIPDNYDHTAVRAYGWGYAKTKSPAGEWVRSNYGVGRGTGLRPPAGAPLLRGPGGLSGTRCLFRKSSSASGRVAPLSYTAPRSVSALGPRVQRGLALTPRTCLAHSGEQTDLLVGATAFPPGRSRAPREHPPLRAHHLILKCRGTRGARCGA